MRVAQIGLCLAIAVLGTAVARADDPVPANYRQLIVETIWAHTNPQSIRGARISQPTELWMGVFAGGNRRAICVEVIRETFLTKDARDVWAFTFKDGRVANAAYTQANCDGYAPFNELLKKK